MDVRQQAKEGHCTRVDGGKAHSNAGGKVVLQTRAEEAANTLRMSADLEDGRVCGGEAGDERKGGLYVGGLQLW